MTQRDDVAEAFVTASRGLIGLAVRSVAAAPVDVTVTQHRVLVLLAARGNLTIGDIAQGLAVNPSNATRYCDRLQRLGLISRARSATDGRVVEVGLTAPGQALIKAVTECRRAEIHRVLDRLTEAQTDAVLDALDAFNGAADEIADRDWAAGLW